jgi:hypothetical protein
MPTIHDFLDAFDAAPTDILRQAAASSVSNFFYVQKDRLREEDPDTYSRAWAVLGWSARTALHLGSAEAPPPPAPSADTRWQTLVHGLPVHVTLCGDLPRLDLPAFLVLLRSARELWPEQAHLHLVISDPDGTLTLEALAAAVGPHVTVALVP